MAEKREIPKARRYPEWVPPDPAAHARYDLALAVASDQMDASPESASALMAAESLYRSDIPTA